MNGPVKTAFENVFVNMFHVYNNRILDWIEQ